MDKRVIWTTIIVSAILLFGGIFFISKNNAPVPPTVQQEALKISDTDWVKGNKNGKVVLVEYLDFECPACGAYYPVVTELAEEFKDEVAVVIRHFPLPMHKNGLSSAWAAEAAGRQNKYWEMVDLMFTNQKNWGQKAVSDPAVFEAFASQLGLNLDQFKADVLSASVRDRVQKDVDSGSALGVNSTPSFFLGGTKINNPASIEDFRTIIKAALLNATAAAPIGEKVHKHADFKVYLNGKAFDFTREKYQSSEENPLDPDQHLHDGNGSVVHQHRSGITLQHFFETLGMSYTKDCFKASTAASDSFCNTGNKTLKFYVNGEKKDNLDNYEFNDLDKILISYGSDSEAAIKTQLNSVSDDACLYSETCPERGEAPTENCVGGLGTDC